MKQKVILHLRMDGGQERFQKTSCVNRAEAVRFLEFTRLPVRAAIITGSVPIGEGTLAQLRRRK